MNKLKFLFSIVERGKAKEYIKKLNGHKIDFNIQLVGRGTAPSEMKDIFGLVNSEKDIVISIATKQSATSFASSFNKIVGGKKEFGGLAMIANVSAVNRVIGELISRNGVVNLEKGATLMENENKYNMIIITVNQGYAEDAMKVAKKAGATGGTIMRGRLADAEKLGQYVEDMVDDEREIISILAPISACKDIMECVNAEYGFNSEAKGTVCSIPVEKAIKI